jgi:hypothetical protein
MTPTVVGHFARSTPRSWVMRMMAEAAASRWRSAQQVEDLRLDGDVERRGGLVGDQQVRVADQRHGDHDALAQAAGELVADTRPTRRAGVAACRPWSSSFDRRGRRGAVSRGRDAAGSPSAIWSPIGVDRAEARPSAPGRSAPISSPRMSRMRARARLQQVLVWRSQASAHDDAARSRGRAARRRSRMSGR